MIEVFGTLGPSCGTEDVLYEMFRRGMTGMRLNLSHVSLKESSQMLETYRAAAERAGSKAELLIDMQGPELRIGILLAAVRMETGDQAELGITPDQGICIPHSVYDALETGDRILIDDGRIELEVTGREQLIHTHVIRGGLLSSRKSLKVINKDIHGPVLTDQDLENIDCAAEYHVTALMQPFVTGAEQLRTVRNVLAEKGLDDVRIFAKIESREGIENLDAIMEEADMVVIARGDLGNDMPLWQLPCAQEDIAIRCRKHKRPFLVVTQMLASMTSSPVPTRAEVSDIFRAVQQGASALMVTNETAVGQYPAEVIRYMRNTADAAEAWIMNNRGQK